MPSITFQKSAKKDFGESDKKLGFIRTLRFPYGIITIHLCYNTPPPFILVRDVSLSYGTYN